MATRNSELLEDFVAYCKANPDQRFYQALRNWSGFPFIIAAMAIDFDTMEFKGTKDTFYWEGKNG